MKKLAIFFVSVFALGVMSSCETCYTCTFEATNASGEVCDDDQKASLEAEGYTCTEN